MLETEIKKLTKAVEELTAALQKEQYIVGHAERLVAEIAQTAPAEEEPPVVEAKLEPVKAEPEPEMTATEAAELNVPPTVEESGSITKDQLLDALRANIQKNGSDEFAQSLFAKYQEGATMSTLSEEFYAPMYAELTSE